KIPARFVSDSKKITPKAIKKYMDAFESEALRQFNENRQRFGDFYKMYNNELSTMELKDYMPSYEFLEEVLDDFEIPSNVYHHDLIGRVVKAFLGRLYDMEDKFMITDLGEIGKSEYLNDLQKIFYKSLQDLINIRVQKAFAIEGINPDTDKKFASQEEQQAYLQKLQQIEQEYSPESAVKALNKSYKSSGVKWAEATLEKDEEELNFRNIYSECLKNFLLSGTTS